MKLIVGLGNPGKEYENTRHNIGFSLLDKFLETQNLKIDSEKFGGVYLKTKFRNNDVIFLKPQRYINLSGEVLRKFVDYYKINIEDIFVIVDDLNLPLGSVKIKRKGSSGGHNGLKNIEQHLGTINYKRLKIGISKNNINMKDYVLGKINGEEKKVIEEVLIKAVDILKNYFEIDFDNLMNKYNTKLNNKGEL